MIIVGEKELQVLQEMKPDIYYSIDDIMTMFYLKSNKKQWYSGILNMMIIMYKKGIVSSPTDMHELERFRSTFTKRDKVNPEKKLLDAEISKKIRVKITEKGMALLNFIKMT